MKTVPLGDVATFVRGVTFKPADVVDDGVGVMRTKNVQQALELTDIIRIPPTLVKRDDQYLREGDILVSSANSWNIVGKACWVPQLTEPLAVGGFVTALRPVPEKIEPRFLYRWFTSPKTQALLRSYSNKTTSISNLNLGRANAMDVPLPDRPEQRRIAAILDRADAIRAKRRQIIAHLEALTQSIFQAMFGDGRHETAPLADFADVSSGITKGRKTSEPTTLVPYLAVANVQAGRLNLDVVKEIEATDREIQRHALRDGDVVLTEGGDPDKLGRGTVWRGELPLSLHQNHIFRVRVRRDCGVDPDYLASFMAGRAAKGYFLRAAKQTTGIASINMTQLKALPVVLPSRAEQAQFATRLSAINGQRAVVERAAAADDELFASLQYRAFRGEL